MMVSINLCAATSTEMIKNGDFSSTVVTNWTLIPTDTSVKGAIVNQEYVITRSQHASASDTLNSGIALSQGSLSLEKGKAYNASFTAKADSAFIAKVTIKKNTSPWCSYSGYIEFPIKTTVDTFKFSFKMDSASDAESRLEFDLGWMRSIGKITLDNISLKLDTSSIGPQPVGEIIKNGDFSSTNLTGSYWKLATENGSKGTMKVENGQLKVAVTKLGTEQAAWEIQCMQTNVKIDSGHTYHVSLHGKADSVYSSMVYIGINKDPWSSYTGWSNNFMFFPDMDTLNFYFDFTMDTASDPAAKFVITLGATAVPNTFTFDNISVKCTDCNSDTKEGAIIARQSLKLQATLIDRNLRIVGVSSPASIRLYDATGKTIFFFGEAMPQKGTLSFPLYQKIAKGVYFTKIAERSAQRESPSAIIRLINQ
jgi:hypothetical protein